MFTAIFMWIGVLRSIRKAMSPIAQIILNRFHDGMISGSARNGLHKNTQTTRANGRRSLGAWRCNFAVVNMHDCFLTISVWACVLRSLRETMSSIAQRVLQKLRFVEKVTAEDEVKIDDCAADSGHGAVRDCKHR